MVRGIEKFKEHFKGFEGKYTLIGGVACGLLLDDAGLEFRGTQDFDIVLIVEAMDPLFGRRNPRALPAALHQEVLTL